MEHGRTTIFEVMRRAKLRCPCDQGIVREAWMASPRVDRSPAEAACGSGEDPGLGRARARDLAPAGPRPDAAERPDVPGRAVAAQGPTCHNCGRPSEGCRCESCRKSQRDREQERADNRARRRAMHQVRARAQARTEAMRAMREGTAPARPAVQTLQGEGVLSPSCCFSSRSCDAPASR